MHLSQFRGLERVRILLLELFEPPLTRCTRFTGTYLELNPPKCLNCAWANLNPHSVASDCAAADNFLCTLLGILFNMFLLQTVLIRYFAGVCLANSLGS